MENDLGPLNLIVWGGCHGYYPLDNLVTYHQVSQLIMVNMCGKKPVTVDRLEWSDVYTI